MGHPSIVILFLQVLRALSLGDHLTHQPALAHLLPLPLLRGPGGNLEEHLSYKGIKENFTNFYTKVLIFETLSNVNQILFEGGSLRASGALGHPEGAARRRTQPT